jgi:hypothetical protein
MNGSKHRNHKKHMQKYREDKVLIVVDKETANMLKEMKNKFGLNSYREVINILLTVYDK